MQPSSDQSPAGLHSRYVEPVEGARTSAQRLTYDFDVMFGLQGVQHRFVDRIIRNTFSTRVA